MSGGVITSPLDNDYGHLGFAVSKRKDILDIANRARKENVLICEP